MNQEIKITTYKEHVLNRGVNNKKYLAIVMHGYGSSANNMLEIAKYIDVKHNIHFLIPNAPQKCEIYDEGFQWFRLNDINLNDLRTFNKIIQRTADAHIILINFIEAKLQELKMNWSDIILIGFSQGAGMASYTGLAYKSKCAAIISFAGLIIPMTFNNLNMPIANIKSRPPVCAIHGIEDTVMPIQPFYYGLEMLKSNNVPLSYRAFNGLKHTIDDRCISFANDFLNQYLG